MRRSDLPVSEMIKILFFIETLEGGGAEKVLRDLVNHMDRTKFDITVQTVWPCDASKYLAPGIRYKAMYPDTGRISRFRYRAEAESGLAYRLHIRGDYDIECAYLEMGSTKIMSASTNRKAKKLAWVHCDLKRIVSDPAALAKKAAPWYAKFDQVICVSAGVRKSFVELFGEKTPSRVLYNVIDDDDIRRKAEMPLPEGMEHRKLTITAVGRFSKPKNYLRLLRTHERLLREGVDHDLWLVGDGEERPSISGFVQEHGLEASVIMPGFLKNPYPCIRAADVVVSSSSYEGYSTFLTEGIILGKPIVTTAVFGTQELLGDSEYGMITENDDDSFYRGVRTMLENEILRAHYGEKAAALSMDYNADRLTESTEEFLMELVGN